MLLRLIPSSAGYDATGKATPSIKRSQCGVSALRLAESPRVYRKALQLGARVRQRSQRTQADVGMPVDASNTYSQCRNKGRVQAA